MPLPFGGADGNDDEGGGHLPEREEREERGWAVLAARARAVVGDWAGPVGLAWLPPALASFLFFLKTLFFFYFLF